MGVAILLFAGLALATVLFLRQEKLGASPRGERLERIRRSPHYRDGKFRNLTETPLLSEGHGWLDVLYRNYVATIPHHHPTDTIPSVKTDLRNLPTDADALVWFGHSSYFLQLAGQRILVDPVFSGQASPLPGTLKAFPGTDVYKVADLPTIDYLFISHDHYDHLDYETIVALRDKVGTVICGLGVGSHFERWGYAPDRIVEKDWYEALSLEGGIQVYVEPARHFSGRGLSSANTLWASYVLQTPTYTVYLGGDSGYDRHYADIGRKYGPIDLAILDNGQYDEAWREVHNLPEDVLLAARDLRATSILPVHSSKFPLAAHPWDEPLRKLTELNEASNFRLVTPLIGERVDLGPDSDGGQAFSRWWERVR
ncbi:L-ascorbate metabolism protein UlaG (beta-lactamase superfamily) [Neolewinella xylanilytica]|uniref:L-ascorbate metabolism protein UlaG (Beta-lactamase superfamily) n=2 Tax=Neolewinella xylanilytica TaxID=1514080 RepID=A0A2S6I8R2_9BACT|nr:L-ascorbate metabolism protein UlaG (beta-lactamase superfamily) [Neolewinella xylanilytica]